MKSNIRRFGIRFGELRRNAGLTNIELAKRLDVAPSLLSKSERRETGPINQQCILKASEIFGSDPAELIELASLDRGYVEIDAHKLSGSARRMLCEIAVNPKLADCVLGLEDSFDAAA